MQVIMIAHTQLSKSFRDYLFDRISLYLGQEGQQIALTAIRTCYSANKPSEIVTKEGHKYFGEKATDGEKGTEADRLIRQIVHSKHLSTLEHLTFTFAVEDVSRALLAQLTRHRVGFSYSAQSQRYVKLGSGDRSGGFDNVKPATIGESIVPKYQYMTDNGWKDYTANDVFDQAMRDAQNAYDKLRSAGVPAEDARAVLPNAATTNLVMTANLRALLDFYSKRKPGNGAQGKIAQLAVALKDEVIKVEPWTESFFN
ncbi:FAD-dependent thymidylate synthase [Halalkalibacter krulwichiae]|uniref:FAD-dependent thymidylate synthase n=1 Tax=Halalkalibacter krulwichiae TaxID=199441 RepID=A0A1X9M996_9BACI|nr:FAD-dependent thymidylate synthase [Halalkalibacter krulwichiae]ARK28753.1 Thymidylate synthase ThyX [Halalkalibacter krulwichiae]